MPQADEHLGQRVKFKGYPTEICISLGSEAPGAHLTRGKSVTRARRRTSYVYARARVYTQISRLYARYFGGKS